MNRPYLDRYIVHNSSLSCFLLTLFVQQYELEASEHPLDLLKLKLVLPFAWDEASRGALCSRNARSKLDAILRETPELKVDLEQRVASRAAVTIQGLNLAVSTKLLAVTSRENDLPVFSNLIARWPKGTKSALPKEMVSTVNRLANWYASVDTPTLIKLFFGIPNEISH
ncbi:three component ABC system middle component [Pseudomonas sp. 5FOS]|uniref:three component ABC system middle component n=1 Tax=unclassified Pseudomonas TaxID=196821 RepID=UPI002FE27C59